MPQPSEICFKLIYDLILTSLLHLVLSCLSLIFICISISFFIELHFYKYCFLKSSSCEYRGKDFQYLVTLFSEPIAYLKKYLTQDSSVANHIVLSYSVLFDPLRPYELQHTRISCPSPSPRACSNSCPLGQWYHPNISSSAIPFSLYLHFFLSSGSFLMSQLFTSDGQSIGDSLQHQSFQWIFRVYFL